MDVTGNITRAFATTPDGQVHYRVVGEGPPVVLLHWAPGSGRQNASVAAMVSQRRFRVFSPDLMGYGDSDKPATNWTIFDYARNLGFFLDALGLDSAYIYGGHTSAAISAEFAANSPHRVKALILDGSPLYDEVERKSLVGSYAKPMEIDRRGKHMNWAWKRAMRHENMSVEEAFADCIDLLKAGCYYHVGYDATFSYDMSKSLPKLRMPTLAMTNPDDPLFQAHEKVVAKIPNCLQFIGPPRFAKSMRERNELEARVLAEFFLTGRVA
jgi:pimeloyl-ACP methyl ester carboxylesterase